MFKFNQCELTFKYPTITGVYYFHIPSGTLMTDALPNAHTVLVRP